MYRINLHCHTHNSDGEHCLREMAEYAKDLGHCALVVTDHDGMGRGAYFRNIAEYDVLKHNDLLPLPIVIGAEIQTPFGEMLLFGKRALNMWHHYNHDLDYVARSFSINTWVDLFERYILCTNCFDIRGNNSFLKPKGISEYALIIPHPRFLEDWVNEWPQKWFDLVHGFEIQNSFEDYLKVDADRPNYTGGPLTIAALRNRIGPCGEYRNSDAHAKEALTMCHNEIEEKIEDEHQLIRWIQSKKRRKK